MRRQSADSTGSTGSSGRYGATLTPSSSTVAHGRRRSSHRLESVWEKQAQHRRWSSNMWSNAAGRSVGLIPHRELLGPLFLCAVSPLFVMVLCRTLVHCDGSLLRFWQELRTDGVWGTFYGRWPSCREPDVWRMILAFMALQLVILKVLPGRRHLGPVTPAGNQPVYKANGFQAFVVSMLLFNVGVAVGLFPGSVLYDRIGEILSTMNVLALTLCTLLYLKGRFAPNSSDSGCSGTNPVFDFYWGTELHPRLLGVDVKQFTNSRCGMMFWGLFVVSCVYKQQEQLHQVSYGMWVNAALQLVYIAKFFWWETGYFSSIDIMHDRAGFYICWGTLAFLPCVYTSHSMFLAAHPDSIGLPYAGLLLVAGLAFVWINYDCDRQRQQFRAANGRCKIWNEDPFFIEAKYKTSAGETKTSLLLGSGWWGISRHFHYLPEIAASACWTLPVACAYWLPYFYLPYLTLLLVDRAFRDDARCGSKYGKYWEQYCKRVPYMIVPGLL